MARRGQKVRTLEASSDVAWGDDDKGKVEGGSNNREQPRFERDERKGSPTAYVHAILN